MAKIFDPDGNFLAARDVARWANKVHKQNGGKGSPFSAADYQHSLYDDSKKRLFGHMCNCGVDEKGFSNGEFVLLPLDNETVKNGGKAYMTCRLCGASSHL